MKYFFEDSKKRKELKRILEEWVGTPHRHHCGVKGKGTDCIHFVARVYQEIGVWEKVKIPEYAPDWHLHRSGEMLLEGIVEQGKDKIVMVGCDNPIDGDIILYQFGRASAHAGIYCEGYIYHAINKIGVRKTYFTDQTWTTRKRYGVRILA